MGALKSPSEAAEALAYVAERGDIFRAAHALLKGFQWDEEPTIEDVVSVSMFLAGDTITGR